jgi:hypothetical protein
MQETEVGEKEALAYGVRGKRDISPPFSLLLTQKLVF